MIPDFNSNGNLLPGIHYATWKEFSTRYGVNVHRVELINGLICAIQVFKAVGCQTLFIDGSFVSSKILPNDYDAIWEQKGVDINLLNQIEPAFLSFNLGTYIQKAKYRGEFFPDIIEGSTKKPFLEFFQTDKHSGERKGIIALDLRSI